MFSIGCRNMMQVKFNSNSLSGEIELGTSEELVEAI